MKNVRRGFAALLVLAMLLPSILIPGMAAGKFQDVPDGSWYSEAVEYVTERGYMAGVSEDSFAPNKPVTRAMFVAILAKVAGAELDDTDSTFSDVPAGKWYTGAVAWAAENGIVSGISADQFAPDRKVTRQDMCVIMARFVEVMNYKLPQDGTRTFTDAKAIGKYARDAVAACTASGLIAGYSDGTFRPKGTATRAQVAVIIMNLDKILNGQAVDPIPMPAQSFDGEAGEGMTVSVNAPEGALPENTNMTVSRVTDEAALAAIAEQAEAEIFAAADISFTKDGAELEPEKAVEVQISLDGLEDLANPCVIHIKDDGTVEYLNAEVVSATRGGEKALRFYAKDFSVYAVGDGGANTVKLLTVEFRDKAGNIINVQALRVDQLDRYVQLGKDFVYDPGVPSITDTQSFEGWANSNPFTPEQHGFSVEEINEQILSQKDRLSESTVDVTWTYYAKVYDVRYVVYHDQAGAVLMTQAYHVDGSNPSNVEINWPYVGFKGGQNFAGWVTDSAIQKDAQDNEALLLGDYPMYKDGIGTTYQVYLNEHTYQLSDTLQLYPYLNTGHWLVFDTYKDQDADSTSTSFISPDFYEEGEPTVAPEVPVRTGYEFKGWFKPTYDADGKINGFGDRFIFGSALNEDITVVAKWEAKSTTYRISVWQQLSTDVVDSDNLNNEYAYYEPTTVQVVLSANTGDQVSLAEAYKLLGNQNDSTTQYGEMGYYFVFNEARSNKDNNGGTVTVKGDGTTVLNAYYDRKLITINFWTDDSMSSQWSGDAYVKAGAGESAGYYYYSNSSPTGYYILGSGPNASRTPQQMGSFYRYNYYYSADAWDNSISFLSDNSNLTSRNYSSSETYVQNASGHWFYRYTSSGEYRYMPLFYSYTSSSSYASGYYQVGTGPNPTAQGTFKLVSVSSPYVGLYQAPLENWPLDPGTGYEWKYTDPEAGTLYGITYRDAYDIPRCSHTVEWNIYSDASNVEPEKIVHWMLENVDDNDYTERTISALAANVTQYYDSGKFLGFDAYGHNLTANNPNSDLISYNSNVGIRYQDAGENSYVFYKRSTYRFEYMSNNVVLNPQVGVKYQKNISSFASYVPTNGNEGYYFDGWYADPGCTVEYEFEEMPDHDVTIYAKWTQIRFRVVCDPTGGENIANPASVITIPNNQATTFRIDYGETVDGTNLNEATRDGYTLLGWYLDTDKTNDTVYDTPFDFGTPMTTHNNMADMTYATSSNRTGIDPWKDNEQYDDSTRPNVVGKITIYAKWRQNPDGVVGINVEYVATDVNGNTGKFASNNDTVWPDPNIYADKAMAFGQPASTPDDSTLQFLYWEILDKSGNVVGKAYPGQLWEVNIENAVVTDLTAQAVYVTSPDALSEPGLSVQTVSYVSETYESQDAALEATEEERQAPANGDNVVEQAPVIQAGGTRAAATYTKVTSFTPGKRYLITYVNGSNAYILGDTYYNNGSNCQLGVSATVSSNTITGDYDAYLFGAASYSTGYRLGSLGKLAYLGLDTEDYPYFGSNNEYWTIETSNSNLYLKNAANDSTSSYPYLSYNSTYGYFAAENSQRTNTVITLFERVEDASVSGVTYNVSSTLEVGKKYIIAIDNVAVGNQPVNNSNNDHFINAIPVEHNTGSQESVTIASGNVNAATWEIVSGDATNGYIFRNVDNSKYLGMSDDGGYYLAATTEALASSWTYDNGTDLNNHETASNNYNSDSGKYYYYLSVSTEFLDYTTSTASGQNVKFYEVTEEPTPVVNDLDAALNVAGGTLHFETSVENTASSPKTYPWGVESEGGRTYAKSGNAGVASSESTISTTFTAAAGDILRFDFKAWGEGSETSDYDKCRFYIDGNIQFNYGARDNDWETLEYTLTAGVHTFTWTYKKDGSVNPTGDYFMVDNVEWSKAIVSYNVTFMDGYTNTQIGDVQQVAEGESAVAPTPPDHTAQGMIFTGWDTAYDNVTENLTVTALYVSQSSLSYTVTFKYMLTDGTWTSAEQTVQHGSAATPPTVPNPPAGYTFNSWDKNYTNITSNLTVNAVYKMVATEKYTVTLRARYGLKSTEAKTHIYWYANNGTADHNGAGVRQEMNGIDINAAQNIPTPSTYTYVTANQTNMGLVYEGHTFLGWARLENETGADECAHPELTEKDLYLKWDAASGRYYLNTAADTRADPVWSDDTYAKVAADEMRPYHDMYAVWESHVFYVFHSSSGKLQAFTIPTSTESSGSMIGTFDITALVAPNHLYGGYYSTYGGVNMTELQKLARTIGANTWTAGSLVSSNWSEVSEIDASGNTDVSFVAYTGASLKNGSTRFWTKADAYNADSLPEGMTAADVNGETMKPQADKIYYLKEVPDKYLHSKYAFVYTVPVQETNPAPGSDDVVSLDQMYLLTVVDDTFYKSVGFRTADTYANAAAQPSWTDNATLTPKFTIIQKECEPLNIPARQVTITAANFTGVTRGYVGVLRSDDLLQQTGFTLLPSWQTLDGVVVGSTAPIDITVASNNVTSENTEIPESEEDNKVYIDCGYVSWWLSEGAVVKVECYPKPEGANDGFVTVTQIEGTNIFWFEKPEGSNGFKIFRYGPDGTSFWNKSVYISYNSENNFLASFNYVGQQLNANEWIQDDNEWYNNNGVSWKTYIP